MLSALIIPGTEETPDIILDHSNNRFEIKGRSLPEDALKFYAPVKTWIDDYLQTPNTSTDIDLMLDYYNSSSAKQLLEILIKLEDLKSRGKNTKILWHCHKEDELMQRRGKEIEKLVELPFEMVIHN